MRNVVHCKISTLATVNSVTAATRTVVIRLQPPVSAGEQQQDRRQGGDGRPEMLLVARKIRPPRRDHRAGGAGDRLRTPGEGHVGRLADGPFHRGDLRLRGQHHDQPEPAQPRDAQPRAGQRVERRQRRLAVGDRVTPELHLDEDLDHARQQDQPEQAEAGLGPQAGRVDQLAGPHDRRGQDQPGPDLPDRARERVRRLLDRLGRQRVKIFFLVVHAIPATDPVEST